MKQYINNPSKVITGVLVEATPSDFWPYDNGNDPYWANGSMPKPYRWIVTFTVNTQFHSSPFTRVAGQFNGNDINVGDYVADTVDGIALKVVRVVAKADEQVTCEVEDTLRYNTFRDYTGQGNGIFAVGSDMIVFELNETGQPVVDVSGFSVGSNFYNNLSSRFQNLEQQFNFILEKENHGFEVGDLISADPENNTFVLASPSHPFIIGKVSNVDFGPNAFAFNPFEKVVDNFNSLLGDVGSIIYADDNNPGGYATVGNRPVMIGLRQETKTISVGTIADPSSQPGYEFAVNGQSIMTSGGGLDDFISDVNAFSSTLGVVAEAFTPATVAQYTSAPAGIAMLPVSATINGVTIDFVTTTNGEIVVGAPGFASVADMIFDINSSNIPNIVADVYRSEFGDTLRLTNTAGGEITIVNGSPDGLGKRFAGENSITGLDEITPANTTRSVRLIADDARAIDLVDISGSALRDFGLVSAENGIKAAAIFIDRGIRQASTYVVANIAARDAINALFGDQCFVQDKGNGEWAHFIRTLDNQWVKVADKDSSESDAQTVEIEIDHTSTSDVIYTVSGGSRVTFVTVTVTEQFNGLNPTISVGDADDNARLMTEDQNDLTSLGVYSTTPSYIYSGGQDVNITFTFNAANSTSGKAVIAISYT